MLSQLQFTNRFLKKKWLLFGKRGIREVKKETKKEEVKKENKRKK